MHYQGSSTFTVVATRYLCGFALVFDMLTATLHYVIYANSGCHIFVTFMLHVKRSLILLLMGYNCIL